MVKTLLHPTADDIGWSHRSFPPHQHTSYKFSTDSEIMQRSAYMDVHVIGRDPKYVFALFGGGGVDEIEYAKRAATLDPVISRLAAQLSRVGEELVLLNITAPYDVPIRLLKTKPEERERWNQHVLTDLLGPWKSYNFFVAGYSGGVVLALNGLHSFPRCFGGACFGADEIPCGFELPPQWKSPLVLVSAPADRVSSAGSNRDIERDLVGRGVAERKLLSGGGHRLADYATMPGMGEIIRKAGAMCPAPSV